MFAIIFTGIMLVAIESHSAVNNITLGRQYAVCAAYYGVMAKLNPLASVTFDAALALVPY